MKPREEKRHEKEPQDALRSWHQKTLYAKPDDWIFPPMAAQRDIALAITDNQGTTPFPLVSNYTKR